jgi:hypothetical protein
MAGLRDYDAWHHHYDDPGSGLSWRLRRVQAHLGEAVDRHPGPFRILSACSGDGRDVITVLAGRLHGGAAARGSKGVAPLAGAADRVRAVLIELHPDIAERARAAAATAGLPGVDVRNLDAGTTDAYVGAVPADLVLLVGIFGNISDEDLWRTIEASPQLCAPEATLIWSRARDDGDRSTRIRARLAAAGFADVAYETRDGTASRPSGWSATSARRSI